MIFLRQYALLCECFLCEIANVWNNMTEQVMSIFVIYFKVEAIVSLLSCVWVMVFAFCNLHWPAIGFGTNCTQYTEPPGPKWPNVSFDFIENLEKTMDELISIMFFPRIQSFHIRWPASAKLSELNLFRAFDCSVWRPRTAFNRPTSVVRYAVVHATHCRSS